MRGLARFAGAVVAVVAVAPWAAAQPVDVTAEVRDYDIVTVRGLEDPLKGTIQSGRDPDAPKLVIRLLSGLVHEVSRGDVLGIVPRETPTTAFQARAKAIAGDRDPAIHRRLAEWGYGHGLLDGAAVEVRKAAELEPDPLMARAQRERLCELLLERQGELDGPPRDAVLEDLLAQATAEPRSARLLLAEAFVLTELRLYEAAVPPLRAAVDELLPAEGEAAGPPGEGTDGQEGAGTDGQEGAGTEASELAREALLRLADVYRILDQPAACADTLERLLAKLPGDRAAALTLAEVAPPERREAAVAALDEALQRTPKDPTLLRARGELNVLGGALGPAKADFAAALRQVPAEDPPSDERRLLLVGAARVELLAGRLDAAQKLLTAADQAPGFGQARLLRALHAELSGDPAAADGLYGEAEQLLEPDVAEAAYGRAWARAAAGDLEAGTSAARRAFQGGYDFQLVVRALIDLARRGEKGDEAGRLIELLARATPNPSPRLLAALARVQVERGDRREATRLYERALAADAAHVDSLRGLAYLAYVSGDLARARELFERLLADDADDPWAAVGLRQLDEARARRVWADAFDRDGPEVLGGWAVEAPYGVTVALRDGAVRFDGSQANEAVGKTRVFRKLEDEQLARFEATVSASPVNRVRFGLRVEGTKRRVVLFFDPAGEVLRASIGKGKGPWSDPIDLGPWPPGRHTLAIDVQDRKADRVVFWIDGQQRGELKLPGIGRARDAVELTLYVQGSALGERADVAFEQARVFVERPEATRRGGGF